MKSLSSLSVASLTCGVLILSSLSSPLLMATVATASDQIIAQSPTRPRRLRVAIMDFDFASTGLTGSNFTYSNGGGPGQGVSDMLTNQMVRNGTFSIIERSRIEQVLREQNLGAAGRIDASTAARIGRILGVDAVVIGSVTRFNLEERRSGISVFGIGSSRRRYTADVQVTARMVNTTTGEIMAVADGSGQAEQGNSSVSVIGLFSSGNDSSGNDRLLSEAATQAVNALVTELTRGN